MRGLLILIMAMSFCGCSIPTAAVRSQVVSYDDAIEDITNKLLVLNILRAKDKAPLHFDEIPSIHESIQATGSLSLTVPYGPRPPNWTRNSVTPGLSLQVSPSFEIDHLDTKDFVTGIASPIDPKFVKYWLDRGLDRRIVLLLFFSAVDITATDPTDPKGNPVTIRIRNSPREAIDNLIQLGKSADESPGNSMRCDRQSDFQHYLRFINTLTTFYTNSYIERRMLAQNLNLQAEASAEKTTSGGINVSSIAALDPNKYQWVRDSKTHTYTIYAVSPEHKTALCDSGYQIAGTTGATNGPSRCSTSVYDVQTDDPMQAEAAEQTTVSFSSITEAPQMESRFCQVFNEVVTPKEKSASQKDAPGIKEQRGLRLEIRSVGEIIQFLGDLVEYQEELENFKSQPNPPPITLNYPVTFGYCPNGIGTPGCNDVFFNLRSDTCNARFTLTYRGKSYSVPNYNPPGRSLRNSFLCSSADLKAAGPSTPKDHTLEVLAVVHQLVDLQKSAQDIKETPYVQVLP